MSRLVLNPSVLLSPLAEGYVAYNTDTNCLHELNPTAALLVELCDGTRTAAEVITLAAPLLPPDSEAAVCAWLEQAIEQTLLIERPVDQQNEVRELSADDLIELASRLRDEGKVQAAFLCQQRAAELEPGSASFQRDLGELAHIVGRRDDARMAYERYLTLQPDDAEIRHLLTSLHDTTTPARVPDGCIQQLYRRFSGFYESNMCDELSYEGPEHLTAVIEDAIGERRELSILDLGCGTGLAGDRLKDRAAHLVGIDLSAEMIELAARREIYDRLEVAEVTQWLDQATGSFDLVVACDTFIYFGDLNQVIGPASRLLNPGGVIAFSVESAAEPPYRLTDSGRYVHHREHIENVARSFGLQVTCREAFLRMEYGNEVTALYPTMTPL
jgi:predicted TPR repeat methyltransferase